MTPLFGTALQLQNFFIQRQRQFCIIGGIGVLRWGEPRFTRDVGVTLLTGYGCEDEFILPILSSGYRGRIPDAAEFAGKNRVLLIESGQGVPIDIAFAGLPFEALVVERSSLYEFESGCSLRQRDHLDWDYIDTQLRPLAELKEQPEIMLVLSKLRQA
jgi:hypothetical protein